MSQTKHLILVDEELTLIFKKGNMNLITFMSLSSDIEAYLFKYGFMSYNYFSWCNVSNDKIGYLNFIQFQLACLIYAQYYEI